MFRFNPFNDPFFHSPMKLSKTFDSIFNDLFQPPRYYTPRYRYMQQQQQQTQQQQQENRQQENPSQVQNKQNDTNQLNNYEKYEREYEDQLKSYNEARRKLWEQERMLREKYDKKQEEYYKQNQIIEDPFEAFFWNRDPFFGDWPFQRSNRYFYSNNQQQKKQEIDQQQQDNLKSQENNDDIKNPKEEQYTQNYYTKHQNTDSYINKDGQKVVTTHLVENNNGEETHKLCEKIYDKDNKLLSEKNIDGQKAIEDYQKGEYEKFNQQKIEDKDKEKDD